MMIPLLLLSIKYATKRVEVSHQSTIKTSASHAVGIAVLEAYNPGKTWATQRDKVYSAAAQALDDRAFELNREAIMTKDEQAVYYSDRALSGFNLVKMYMALSSYGINTNYSGSTTFFRTITSIGTSPITTNSLLCDDFPIENMRFTPSTAGLSFKSFQTTSSTNTEYFRVYYDPDITRNSEKLTVSLHTGAQPADNYINCNIACLGKKVQAYVPECNVDIILTVPTNHAACTALNNNSDILVAPSSATSTPLTEIAHAYQAFLKRHFIRTRGVAVGVIPYSGKISLPPNRAGWTTAIPPMDTGPDKPYLKQALAYGTDGQEGGDLIANREWEVSTTGEEPYDWGDYTVGFPIMFRRGAVEKHRSVSYYTGNNLLLSIDEPTTGDKKFQRMNMNPCYLGHCNILTQMCERTCPTYMANPYFITELTDDLQKVIYDFSLIRPINDPHNKSNFLFLAVNWAQNLLQSWTDPPTSSALGNSKFAPPSRNAKKAAVIIIINEPDHFEPSELTYLGFNNDASEIPMFESDTINFGYNYGTDPIAGAKGSLVFTTTQGNVIYNTEGGENHYETYGSITGKLTFPAKGVIKLVVKCGTTALPTGVWVNMSANAGAAPSDITGEGRWTALCGHNDYIYALARRGKIKRINLKNSNAAWEDYCQLSVTNDERRWFSLCSDGSELYAMTSQGVVVQVPPMAATSSVSSDGTMSIAKANISVSYGTPNSALNDTNSSVHRWFSLCYKPGEKAGIYAMETVSGRTVWYNGSSWELIGGYVGNTSGSNINTEITCETSKTNRSLDAHHAYGRGWIMSISGSNIYALWADRHDGFVKKSSDYGVSWTGWTKKISNVFSDAPGDWLCVCCLNNTLYAMDENVGNLMFCPVSSNGELFTRWAVSAKGAASEGGRAWDTMCSYSRMVDNVLQSDLYALSAAGKLVTFHVIPPKGKVTFTNISNLTGNNQMNMDGVNVESAGTNVNVEYTVSKEMQGIYKTFYILPEQISNTLDENGNYSVTFNMEDINLISADISNHNYEKVVPTCSFTDKSKADARNSTKQVLTIQTNVKAPLTIKVRTNEPKVTFYGDNGVSKGEMPDKTIILLQDELNELVGKHNLAVNRLDIVISARASIETIISNLSTLIGETAVNSSTWGDVQGTILDSITTQFNDLKTQADNIAQQSTDWGEILCKVMADMGILMDSTVQIVRIREFADLANSNLATLDTAITECTAAIDSAASDSANNTATAENSCTVTIGETSTTITLDELKAEKTSLETEININSPTLTQTISNKASDAEAAKTSLTSNIDKITKAAVKTEMTSAKNLFDKAVSAAQSSGVTYKRSAAEKLANAVNEAATAIKNVADDVIPTLNADVEIAAKNKASKQELVDRLSQYPSTTSVSIGTPVTISPSSNTTFKFDGPRSMHKFTNISEYTSTGGPNFGHNLSIYKVKYKLEYACIVSATLKNQFLRCYGHYGGNALGSRDGTRKSLILNTDGHIASNGSILTTVEHSNCETYVDPCIQLDGNGSSTFGAIDDGKWNWGSVSGGRYAQVKAYNFHPACWGVQRAYFLFTCAGTPSPIAGDNTFTMPNKQGNWTVVGKIRNGGAISLVESIADAFSITAYASAMNSIGLANFTNTAPPNVDSYGGYAIIYADNRYNTVWLGVESPHSNKIVVFTGRLRGQGQVSGTEDYLRDCNADCGGLWGISTSPSKMTNCRNCCPGGEIDGGIDRYFYSPGDCRCMRTCWRKKVGYFAYDLNNFFFVNYDLKSYDKAATKDGIIKNQYIGSLKSANYDWLCFCGDGELSVSVASTALGTLYYTDHLGVAKSSGYIDYNWETVEISPATHQYVAQGDGTFLINLELTGLQASEPTMKDCTPVWRFQHPNIQSDGLKNVRIVDFNKNDNSKAKAYGSVVFGENSGGSLTINNGHEYKDWQHLKYWTANSEDNNMYRTDSVPGDYFMHLFNYDGGIPSVRWDLGTVSADFGVYNTSYIFFGFHRVFFPMAYQKTNVNYTSFTITNSPAGLFLGGFTVPINQVLVNNGCQDAASNNDIAPPSAASNTPNAAVAAVSTAAATQLKATTTSNNTRIYLIKYRTNESSALDTTLTDSAKVYSVTNEASLKETLDIIASDIKSFAGYTPAHVKEAI
jgi:hypothetical protein